MSEAKSHIAIQRGTEKSFGILFSIIFFAVGLYFIFDSEAISYSDPLSSFKGAVSLFLLCMAPIILLLAYYFPNTLTIPNRLWFKFGMVLGAIVTPFVMAIVYYVAVVPIGIMMRLLGKDPLNRVLHSGSKTYWIEREQPIGTMKNQY